MSIGIHAGKQYFSSTKLYCLSCPVKGINAGWPLTTINKDLPPGAVGVVYPFGIYGDDNALAAEFCRPLANQSRIEHRRCVYRHLVCSSRQHTPHIAYAPQPTTYGQGYKDLLGDALNNIYQGIPPLRGSGYIQKDQLISALLIVKAG